MADEPAAQDVEADESVEDRSSEDDPGATRVAIACQGGGSHTAFTAGALQSLLADAETNVVGLSGTSGGAICATAAWYGLLAEDETPASVLDAVWTDVAARSPLDRALNAWTVWGSTIEASGFPTPSVSPYHNPAAGIAQKHLRRALADNVDFDRFADLATEDAPRLVVGTVDVEGGAFETFADGDVTADAVLASTAIPELFPGVEIDGHVHWDGVFSHNPPINALMNVDRERKPEELWIVQINPDGASENPTSLREIQDRRNELAGNLSLNQQLHLVRRVNDWLDAGHLPESDFQTVKIRRMELDRDLSYATKLDRDADFLDDLRDLGADAAAEFCDRREAGDVDEHFHVDATAIHDAHADDD
ncbi:patatin-like phospholipase family protein [Halorubellus sp. JP-L1]|uniref:patatin-like phospholipase family protein n=1 Tax=Halorubellus sp. JP-L1 TaxID=2715753 RepID=UPI00140B0F34|nr:patatin-like phospholipase family protein [Halorubellus sp. JP-L1]NHN43441.1 patatin-like phospholipase family protein [Halorubellus sp. JP-L1]